MRKDMAEETRPRPDQSVADRPHHWTIGLSIGAIVVSLGSVTFSWLQYRSNTLAVVVQQRPWLNLEHSDVNIADGSATFDWRNRRRTPALNVESFEWVVLGKRSDSGFQTLYTSDKRHIRYNNIWVDGVQKTASLSPSAAKNLPMVPDTRLRLFGLITYKDFFGTNTYHIYYCYEVVPNVALFPCPEPELNRVD